MTEGVHRGDITFNNQPSKAEAEARWCLPVLQNLNSFTAQTWEVQRVGLKGPGRLRGSGEEQPLCQPAQNPATFYPPTHTKYPRPLALAP